MIRPDSWMARAIAGEDAGDIDDEIERWHGGEHAGVDLPTHLGMNAQEYSDFVLAPEALEHIVATRRMVEAARIEMTAQAARLANRIN